MKLCTYIVRKQYHLKGRRGFTLIEIMIYIPLLSLLLIGFIYTAYTVHFQDIQLIQTIDDTYASST